MSLRLYVWTTPNGRKVMIMAEELGLPFEYVPVRLPQGEQRQPEFLAINPNGRIPALVDEDVEGEARVLFESGAILVYMAEKSGRFLAREEPERSRTFSWLMFQMGGIGPMFGQYGHFASLSEKIPYAIERYASESRRLFGVLESRLAQAPYLAGENYSIADMATYPWISQTQRFGIDAEKDFPQVAAYIERVGARPAVQRAMALSF